MAALRRIPALRTLSLRIPALRNWLRRPGWFALLLCGAALLAGGLTWAHQAETGPGLQQDSIEYISVARSLLAGEGFTRFFGGTLKGRPPLYPLLLAGGSLGIFDPYKVAGPLNVAASALIVIFVGRWLRRRLESGLLLAGGCLAAALSPPLLWMAYWALSETAFILLAMLSLICLDGYLDSRRRSLLAGAAALAALAGLMRYLGVAVIAAGVMLLLFQRGVAPADRAKETAVYVFIAAAPVALWILRIYLITGTPIGARDDIYYSAADIWNELVGMLEHIDFLLTLGGSASAAWIAVGLITGGLTLAAAVVVGALIRAQQIKTRWAGRQSFMVFAGFALSYAVVLVIALMSGTTSSWGDPRYLIPLYLPLLIAALLVMDRALSYARSGTVAYAAGAGVPHRAAAADLLRRGGVPLAAALLLTLAIAGQAVMTARSIALANRDYYQGYQHTRWTDSATLRYIREQSLTGVLFSEPAAAAYFHTDIDAGHRYLPCGIAELRQRLSAANDSVSGSDVYIVWFPDWGNPKCDVGVGEYGGDWLKARPWLETVHEAADGVILRFNPNYSNGNG